MKNKFLLIFIMIFSLSFTSCKNSEYTLQDKIKEYYPNSSLHMKSDWYNLERIQYCEINDNKSTITRYKFNGFINFPKEDFHFPKGDTNEFTFSRETIFMNENNLVDKKVIVESFLKNKKFCEIKQVILYEGRNEISNKITSCGNYDIDMIPIYIDSQGWIFIDALYDEINNKEVSSSGTYFLFDEEYNCVRGNFNMGNCVYQEIYFNPDNMSIYKYIDMVKFQPNTGNLYETTIEKIPPINDIKVPDFDIICNKDGVDIYLTY